MQTPTMQRVCLILAFSMFLFGSPRADDIDHERALELVREGRIRPLAEVVVVVHRQVPGELLEVELELGDGAYVYELKILRPGGKIQEVEADAATGKILTIEDDD